MNRVDIIFQELRQKNKKARVSYIMAGQVSESVSEVVKDLIALRDVGFDILEVGFPFSDPVADGSVIQKAGASSIKNGFNLDKTLEVVREFRQQDTKTPVVLMGYYNPILQMSEDEFVKQAHASGVDGIIIPDFPYEEALPLFSKLHAKNIHLINLITQLTTNDRLKKILTISSGFLYYVNILGITGQNAADVDAVVECISDKKAFIESLDQANHIPIVSGFGINDRETAAAICQVAEGFVVGSAIVSALNSGRDTMTSICLSRIL